jgi:membrane associated rhomboid family serine protease
MIPLKALLFRRGAPTVTIVLIAMNVVCFLYEMSLAPWVRERFVYQFALVPDRLQATSFLTSMFLHGGWLHLIGNMWFLWVFGSHIEDAIGSAKYLAFYLLSGIASALVQFVISLGSPVPVIGASGAIAGVMGGFLILYPRVRVLTLVFIFVFITTVELPSAVMLIYWFLLNLLSGLGSLASVSQAQGVAWFAHIGGFLGGMFMVRLFQQNRQRRIY